jgi:hypothetical protein
LLSKVTSSNSLAAPKEGGALSDIDIVLTEILNRQKEQLNNGGVRANENMDATVKEATSLKAPFERSKSSGSYRNLIESQMLTTSPSSATHPATANSATESSPVLLDTVTKDLHTTEDFLRRLALTQQEEIARLSRIQKDLEREARNAAKAEKKQREEVERLGSLAWRLLATASQGKYVSSSSLLSEEEAAKLVIAQAQVQTQAQVAPVVPVRIVTQSEVVRQESSVESMQQQQYPARNPPPLSPRRPSSMPVRFVGINDSDNSPERSEPQQQSSSPSAKETAWNMVTSAPEKLKKGLLKLVKGTTASSFGTPNPLLGSNNGGAKSNSSNSMIAENNSYGAGITSQTNPFGPISQSRKSSYNTAIELQTNVNGAFTFGANNSNDMLQPGSRHPSGRYLIPNNVLQGQQRKVSTASNMEPAEWYDANDGGGGVQMMDVYQNPNVPHVPVTMVYTDRIGEENTVRYATTAENVEDEEERMDYMETQRLQQQQQRRRRSPARRPNEFEYGNIPEYLEEAIAEPAQRPRSELANWVEEQRRLSATLGGPVTAPVSPQRNPHPTSILRKTSHGNAFNSSLYPLQQQQHQPIMETVMMVQTPPVIVPTEMLLQSPKRKPVELTKAKGDLLAMCAEPESLKQKVLTDKIATAGVAVSTQTSGAAVKSTSKGRQDSGLGGSPSISEGGSSEATGAGTESKSRSRKSGSSKNGRFEIFLATTDVMLMY